MTDLSLLRYLGYAELPNAAALRTVFSGLDYYVSERWIGT